MKYVMEKFYNEYSIKKDDKILAVVDSGTNARKICEELNNQEETIANLKEINKRASDWNKRKLMELKRLRRDWDKLWQLCKDNGITEDEMIKELER